MGLLNSKEAVSKILRIFGLTLIEVVVVVEKRSVSAGFALQVKRMILLLPGFIPASARAPLSGSTRCNPFE